MNKIFLYRVLLKVMNVLPTKSGWVLSKLFIVTFLLSIFEIIGLASVIPIINITINKDSIDQNGYLKFLYKAMGSPGTLSFTMYLISIVFTMFLFKAVFTYFTLQYQSKVSYRIIENLTIGRFISYLSKPYSFHIDNNTGVLNRNIVTMPFQFGQGVLMPLINIGNEAIIIILIFVSILVYYPILFTLLVILIVPFFLLYFKFSRKKTEEIRTQTDIQGQLFYKASFESVRSYREIHILNKIVFFTNRFKNSVHSINKQVRSLYMLNSFLPRITEILIIFTLFVSFVLTWLLNISIESLGQFLIIFALAAYRLLPSVNKIVLNITMLKANEYVFDHLADIPENQKKGIIDEGYQEKETLGFDNKITLENIRYSYKDSNDVLLDKLNLEINKGEIVGIIGESGSGKTTLLNILLRLFVEDNGGIYVDNIKIDSGNKNRWYNLINFVPQDPMIIDGNYIENIAFGVEPEQIDYDLINEVIKASGIKELVESSAEGLETKIGESGMKISGGQRQRVAIARALYTKPKILLFDEATSALDSQTEEMITESIKNLSNMDITIILIAHRIESLKYCHKIYLLKKGRFLDSISYKELLEMRVSGIKKNTDESN